MVGDTISTGSSPAVLEESLSATIDQHGRFWVGQRDRIVLFDELGRYVETVGQAGQGPLEFGAFPGPLYLDPNGLVHIFDPGNSRETIVDDHLALVEDRPIPWGITQVAPLKGDHTEALVADMPAPERIGHPLHVLSDSGIVRSMGARTEPGILDRRKMRRTIATDGLDLIFSADRYEYDIQVWNSSGQLLRTIDGDHLNEIEPRPGGYTDENPPPNRILGLSYVDGRLLVLLRIRQQDWLQHMEERLWPNGSMSLAPTGFGLHGVYDTRVDVLDPESGTRLASVENQLAFLGFAGNDVLFVNDFTPVGAPRVGFWRVTYSSSAK